MATIDSITGTVLSLTSGTTVISYTRGPDSNDCSNTAIFPVTVTEGPMFSTDSSISSITCYGKNNGRISIVLENTIPPVRYLWSNGGTEAYLTDIGPGLYLLNITEEHTQCVVTDSFYITQPDSISTTIFVTEDHCNKHVGSIHIDAAGGTGTLNFTWDGKINEPSITGLTSGMYVVTVKDSNNCIKTLPVAVYNDTCRNVTIPDVITPNSDGYNDKWIISGLDLYPDNTIKVFDKWGDAVYEKTGYKNEWDGTGNNNPLPDGTYYYLLKLNAKNILGGDDTFTGTILIKR